MMFLACTTVHYLINLLIVDRYGGPHHKLYRWVDSVRQALKGSTHKMDNFNARIQRLNSIDFPMFPHDKVWSKNFSELLNFEKKDGRCGVPRT